MEWSKVKNIIILILLVVNMFLLVHTAHQERQSQRYREDARSGAVEVLRRQGYEVGQNALPEGEAALAAMTAERDRESEDRLAQSLLGAARKADDGVRVSYAGEKGECAFRSNGSYTAIFTQGAYPAEGELGRHAVKLLTDAGYPCELLGIVEGEGETVVTVRQTWDGTSLFSCTSELTYQGGELRRIMGNRLFGAPARDSGGGEAMDVATALVRFMSGMREGGHVFTTISQMKAGYLVTGSGRKLQMQPAWRVETDAGTFLMDAVTGELNPE